MTEIVSVTMTVNGKSVGPIDIPDDLMMLEFLQEYLNLTGTRYGCGQGICNACAVILDQPDGTSQLVPACITGAHYLQGRSVRTVESHAERDEDGRITKLSPIQQAYLDHFSFQCGYCTPGFVNAATVLIERLRRSPVPRSQINETVLATMNKNICRCTGYVRYLEAVKEVILSSPHLTIDDRTPAKG